MPRRVLQVVMEQLWSHFYMCAKDLCFLMTQTPDDLHTKPLNQLLGYLHHCKVDWTDASLWPEDYIEGQWKRVVPMSFLVAHIRNNVSGSLWIIDALCSGEWCPLLPCSISCAESGPTPRRGPPHLQGWR